MKNIEEIIEDLSKAVESKDDYKIYTQIGNSIYDLRAVRQEMSGVNIGGIYISYYEQTKNDLVNDIFQYLDSYIKKNRREDLQKYRLIVVHGAISNKLCVVLKGKRKNPLSIEAIDNCDVFDILQMNRKGFLSREGYEKFQKIRKDNPEYFLPYINDFNAELDKFL